MLSFICTALALTENDRNLLEQLFTLYEKKVYSLSYILLQDKQDAEDNTIQVFISLSRVLDGVDADLNSNRAKALVYTITRHAAYDQLRKRKIVSDKQRFMETDGYMQGVILDDVYYQSLVEHMKTVSEADTRLLILKYVVGLTSREIAKATGLSAGAVAVRIHRAKAKMKDNGQIREIQEDSQ